MKLRLLAISAALALAACNGADEPAAEATTAAPTAEPQAAAGTEADEATAETAAAAATSPDTATAAAARPQPSSDPLIGSGFEAGTHFEVLSPAQPTSSGPEYVEVAEFFMYSCIHCYNFEPYVQRWLEDKPDYIAFVRVPTVWNELVRLHGQAFYAAEALGKGEEMHAPFFREMHENRNYLQSQQALAEFFGRFGVDEDSLRSVFDSFAVHAKVRRADELARRYGVNSTPSIVVNGKYLTNASMAGGYDRLLELIDTLAASERVRSQTQ